MGSGVFKTAAQPAISAEQMGIEKAQKLLEGKPLDATDLKTFDAAKEEVSRLRLLVQEMVERSNRTSVSTSNKKRHGSNDTVSGRGAAAAPGPRGRGAICASAQKVEDYKHVVVEKPPETGDLILKAIEHSILFKNCGKGDLAQLVEAFAPVNFPKGAQVITQNDEGDDFYVVEEGSLRCFVVFPSDPEEIEVRTPYIRGESFGELALMYNNPRAATLRAAEDCKLWSIKRGTVRAILTSRREITMAKRIELLSNVVIGDVNLQNMLSKSEVEQLVNAFEEEEFAAGECIVREGETGHSFYILQSGEISVHQKTKGAESAVPTEGDPNYGIGPQVTILRPGSYFGERALLSEETRKATCVAVAADGTVCLSLGREDFSRMLGSLEDVLSKAAGIKKPSIATTVGNGNHHIPIKPEDLEAIRNLGQGAFGSVKLVLHKPSGRAFALKCQSKKDIVANELQQHILDERRLLMELDHTFILKLHDSFQDDRYIYFVLEALMGGELFTHLRRKGTFEESAVKFYAATVLYALEHMHDRFIAYRDLKPENLVLDDKGYIKIVDLGLAKVIPTGYTWTICGTPDYLAPEIILNEGHDNAVDFWAFGVLIYEVLAGVAPFHADDPMSTYENILASRVEPPPFFSKPVKDIVRKLLKINKSKRLGKTAGGARAVMKHKWFSGFDWEGLLKRQLEPPINPKLKDAFDASNFNPIGPAQEEPEACPEWSPEI